MTIVIVMFFVGVVAMALRTDRHATDGFTPVRTMEICDHSGDFNAPHCALAPFRWRIEP